MIGDIGHIAIILSLISSVLVWIFSLQDSFSKRFLIKGAWLHFVFVVSSIGVLYFLIFNNHFQYSYVWKHSAVKQVIPFKISCLWEGQEGSFLLWIFWNSLLILFASYRINIRKALLFLLPIQMFLLLLILGVKIPSLGVELGSSPFSLLKNTIKSDIYAINPDFIPSEGQGMNALLQNYWMVIHPPVIFLGFAVSAMPFCLCLSGLLAKKDNGFWVKEAMPWTIVSIISLGLGMLMGSYWAYETLNFGGFWNWDPVENAIYIPWIVSIGAMHLMVVYLKKQKALNALTILTLISYVLVIYSTFLTRSGILGDSSVHSFTDSGLSTQLLVFVLLILIVSIIFYALFYKKVQSKIEEESTYTSFEFWLFVGVLFLCLSAFQVFLPTSFPVFNKISQLIGYPISLATPADQVSYYSNFQMWFALAFIVLIVIAQYFYNGNILCKDSLTEKLFLPSIITVLLFLAGTLYWGIITAEQLKISVLILITVFILVVSIPLFFNSKIKKTGSALSHLGLMVFFVGVLISQGYKKVLTSNTQFTNNLNRMGNLLLVKNKPVKIGDYSVSYNTSFLKSAEGQKIDKSLFKPTFKSNVLLTKQDLTVDNEEVLKGETVEIDSKNIYYNISFKSPESSFTIEPRVQMNSQMGVVASPDIDKFWLGDIYTHVSNFPDPNEKTDWSEAKSLEMRKGDAMILGSKVLKLENVVQSEVGTSKTLTADLKLITPDSTYSISPSIIAGKERTDVIPVEIADKGIELVIYKVDKESKALGFYYLSQPKDWITIKSIYFPMINLVWFGGLMLLGGMFVSLISYVRLPVKKEVFQPPVVLKKSLTI